MLRIELDTANEWYRAYEDGSLMPGNVADTLRNVALALENGELDGPIADGNGNTVGHYSTHDDDETPGSGPVN